MDSYSFFCYGHANIRATHRTTLEFTKAASVSPRGNCIVGVRAEFELEKLKEFLKGKDRIKLAIDIEGSSEELTCSVNQSFDHDQEIVIRKSAFVSERTLGTRADKACSDLRREVVDRLKNSNCRFNVMMNSASKTSKPLCIDL